MRFLITIVWAALIGGVLAYVLTSMADQAFNLAQAGTLTAIIAVAIFLLDAAVLTEQED